MSGWEEKKKTSSPKFKSYLWHVYSSWADCWLGIFLRQLLIGKSKVPTISFSPIGWRVGQVVTCKKTLTMFNVYLIYHWCIDLKTLIFMSCLGVFILFYCFLLCYYCFHILELILYIPWCRVIDFYGILVESQTYIVYIDF